MFKTLALLIYYFANHNFHITNNDPVHEIYSKHKFLSETHTLFAYTLKVTSKNDISYNYKST